MFLTFNLRIAFYLAVVAWGIGFGMGAKVIHGADQGTMQRLLQSLPDCALK